ncbi:MAG: hypothetical protein J6Y74_03855 [Clostridia bacterium]|nr:hypothetical protein [Clostridia bacterium]
MKADLRYEKEVRESSAFRTIESDLRRGEFSHAYFILSEDKDALDTLFALIAMRVYCENACLECKECRKVLMRSKPDVKYLAEGEENFSVEEMSALTEDAGMTSFEGGAKLYFFKNFERVSEAAQNKLLKTLEEPYPGVHFILSAANAASALPTVLSRVKQVILSAFPEEALREGLLRSGVSPERAARGARIGQGSFTRARALAADEDFARHVSEVSGMVRSLKKSSDVRSFLRAPFFSKDRILSTLSILEIVLGDAVKLHLGLPPTLSEIAEDLAEIAEMYTTAALGAALDVITTCRIRLKANCLAQNVADYLMLKMVEVKYKCR